VLRRFVPEDRDGFVEMNRDPGVRKYCPGILTPEESLGEMTRIEQHWDTHGFGPWALDVRGDFAGILGLKWVRPDMPFAPAVELLYRLIPRFWGQGLATEGSLAALEFGFCELHLDTVVAFAVEANTGSRRVMEKVGMVYGYARITPSGQGLPLLASRLCPLQVHSGVGFSRQTPHGIQVDGLSPTRRTACGNPHRAHR
jgi:RimJ/RimL family protein N-acetyltransferase